MGNQLITDIHAHLLPGLDDGPASLSECQELLSKIRETGTDRVFCTSHFLSPHFDVSLERLHESYEEFSNCSMLNVDVACGAEVRVTSSLVDIIQSNQVPRLGQTNYVLVEFRSDVIAQRSLELVHELVVRNFQPIMAHPERNLALQKDPKLLEELLEAGLLLQLTAWCFDKPGREMHTGDKLAWKILEDGMATVIASDAHNTTTRPPGLLDAYDNIASRFGQAVTDALIDNANAIWDSGLCSPVNVEKPKRSLLKSLFR